MNKREAKQWVYRMSAKSLRGLSRRLTLDQCPDGTTAAGLDKLKTECLVLADKLDSKYPDREPIDVEVVSGP